MLKKTFGLLFKIKSISAKIPVNRAPPRSLLPNINKPTFVDWFYMRKLPKQGCLRFKTRGPFSSRKRPNLVKMQQPKLTNHKGLLKRIKIVGPRHARMFKFRSPGMRHKMRKRSHMGMARKKRARYVSSADIRVVRKMIPDYKRQYFKFLH